MTNINLKDTITDLFLLKSKKLLMFLVREC